MKLTAIQLAALRSVAHPEDLFPGGSHAHGLTMSALKRKGLAEKTMAGWRLTDAGRDAIGLPRQSVEEAFRDELRIQRVLRERWPVNTDAPSVGER